MTSKEQEQNQAHLNYLQEQQQPLLQEKEKAELKIKETAILQEEQAKLSTELTELIEVTAYFSSNLQKQPATTVESFQRLHKTLQTKGLGFQEQLKGAEHQFNDITQSCNNILKNVTPKLDDLATQIAPLEAKANQQKEKQDLADQTYDKNASKKVLFDWKSDGSSVIKEGSSLGHIEVEFELVQEDAYGWWMIKNATPRVMQQLSGFNFESKVKFDDPVTSDDQLTTNVQIEITITANGMSNSSGGGSSIGSKTTNSLKGTAGVDLGPASTELEYQHSDENTLGTSSKWNQSQELSSSFIKRIFEYEFISKREQLTIKKLDARGGSFEDFEKDEATQEMLDSSELFYGKIQEVYSITE
ncbi:MAG: hypothetical protein AB8E82_01410 [Aureispira sp.]